MSACIVDFFLINKTECLSDGLSLCTLTQQGSVEILVSVSSHYKEDRKAFSTRGVQLWHSFPQTSSTRAQICSTFWTCFKAHLFPPDTWEDSCMRSLGNFYIPLDLYFLLGALEEWSFMKAWVIYYYYVDGTVNLTAVATPVEMWICYVNLNSKIKSPNLSLQL